MIGPIRIGVTASKSLVFLWLKKDLRLIEGKLGIDLAGGSMFNKKYKRANDKLSFEGFQTESRFS